MTWNEPLQPVVDYKCNESALTSIQEHPTEFDKNGNAKPLQQCIQLSNTERLSSNATSNTERLSSNATSNTQRLSSGGSIDAQRLSSGGMVSVERAASGGTTARVISGANSRTRSELYRMIGLDAEDSVRREFIPQIDCRKLIMLIICVATTGGVIYAFLNSGTEP